ncbi:MAG: N-acetyltransferase family protein [Ilumatobacter sp.]
MEPERTRTRYRVDPKMWQPRTGLPGITVREVRPDDRGVLPALLLDAYTGTIDDEDGTIDDAIEEVDNWFAGTALLAHSHIVVLEGEAVAACLVDEYEDAPWLAYVFTSASNKRRGLGRAAVDASMASLAAGGHRSAGLLITDGNTGSEQIFAQATPTETR